MPQMAPYNWFILYMMFYLIYIYMISYIYFIPINKIMLKKKMSKKIFFKWMW